MSREKPFYFPALPQREAPDTRKLVALAKAKGWIKEASQSASQSASRQAKAAPWCFPPSGDQSRHNGQ